MMNWAILLIICSIAPLLSSLRLIGQRSSETRRRGLLPMPQSRLFQATALQTGPITVKRSSMQDHLDLDAGHKGKQTTKVTSHHHTDISRAKISAANKGKTPWNRNRVHSEETRRKISETVLKNARKKKMEKAAELGMTLEQYEVYLKEEKLKVRRAIQAARTEIKRKKMSDTMKKRWQDPYYRAKYASKRRQPVSDETKKKISAKIKELWAEGKFNETLRRQDYESEEWRFKISQSLKKRWEQPDFREKMIDVLKSRKSGWKAVLSESIRAKWSEPEYREKVQKKSLLSIQAKSEDKQPRPEQPLKPAKDLNAPKLVSRNSTKVSMEERNAKFELKQQKKDDEKKKKEQEKVEKKIAKGESKARLNHAKNKVAAGEVKSGELKGIMGDQLWEDEKNKRKNDDASSVSDEILEEDLLKAWANNKAKKPSSSASNDRQTTTTRRSRRSEDDDVDDMDDDDDDSDNDDENTDWLQDSVIEIYDHGNFVGLISYAEFMERRRKGEFS